MSTKMVAALAAGLAEFNDCNDEVRSAFIDLLRGKDIQVVCDQMTDPDDAAELERLIDEFEDLYPDAVNGFRRKADQIKAKMESLDEDDDDEEFDEPD